MDDVRNQLVLHEQEIIDLLQHEGPFLLIEFVLVNDLEQVEAVVALASVLLGTFCLVFLRCDVDQIGFAVLAALQLHDDFVFQIYFFERLAP